MEGLNDAANCLRLKDRHHLIHELESLGQEFPQVSFCVFLGVLPSNPTLQEISFWLLNHAAFPAQDVPRLNEYAVLLMIDPVAKSAGLNVGYAIEALLPANCLCKVLAGIRTPLWHGEFANGISRALQQVASALRKAGRRAPRRQEFRPPDTDGGFLQASGLEPLRGAAPASAPSSTLQEQGLPTPPERGMVVPPLDP